MKNQVRHGNLVLITPFGENDILVLNDDELKALYIHENWDRIKPIQLTEKWYNKIQKQLADAGLEYSHSSITNRLFVYIGNRLIECDYLHTAQNLFFALTGEELKINS